MNGQIAWDWWMAQQQAVSTPPYLNLTMMIWVLVVGAALAMLGFLIFFVSTAGTLKPRCRLAGAYLLMIFGIGIAGFSVWIVSQNANVAAKAPARFEACYPAPLEMIDAGGIYAEYSWDGSLRYCRSVNEDRCIVMPIEKGEKPVSITYLRIPTVTPQWWTLKDYPPNRLVVLKMAPEYVRLSFK